MHRISQRNNQSEKFVVNRSIAPEIKAIGNIRLPEINTYQLDNGIPLFEICMGTQDVIKLEIVFNAGRPFEKQPLVAKTACNLLKDGTEELTGAAIADILDYYGGALEFPFQMDTGNIALFTISKHLKKTHSYFIRINQRTHLLLLKSWKLINCAIKTS